VARRIYGHFELPMPAETEAALVAHAGRHTQGKHGRHEYDLEKYGLDGDRVRTRLAAYIERFRLPSD